MSLLRLNRKQTKKPLRMNLDQFLSVGRVKKDKCPVLTHSTVAARISLTCRLNGAVLLRINERHQAGHHSPKTFPFSSILRPKMLALVCWVF